MKKLGVYFGLNAISIVEVDGRRILNQSQIPLVSGQPEATAALDSAKLISLFEDELVKLKINTREAVLTLTSKDLIIRSFDIPNMPREEIPQAVSSEVIKYIPFKVEDLTYDFQIKAERKERKNYVLFVATKNDDLERNITLLKGARLDPLAIEYSAFSVLRLLKLSNIEEKGSMAFIDIDPNEESNITILEDGFPYFSRNLKILSEEADAKLEPGAVLEQVKNEVRISLDYYRRKFPNKQLRKAVFLVKEELRYEIEAMCKELDLVPSFVKLPVELEGQSSFGLGTIKAYAAILDVKLSFAIDVLSGKARVAAASAKRPLSAPAEMDLEPLPPIKIQPGVIGIGLLIIASVYIFILVNKVLPVKKEIKDVIGQRQPLATVSVDKPYTELQQVESEYSKKLKILDDLFKKRQYITPKFDFIPNLLTEGMWLTAVSYNDDSSGQKLVMRGVVYLADQDKEVASLQKFLSDVKLNPVFRSSFSDINLISYRRDQYKNIELTSFEIDCVKK